ncbi:hypothetical protein QBC46DRAFT_449511 [Diplogelasinospora grovesii]|uniref:Uncharacterized protein n=1 Tax=Diplogelasinospora grovesii TaxID=303347 RepID=A0AAN6N751_9PEZI|nr:hypothetical protein QBC46DRAFT_449511 [Diplogelasinospora grovesii]
MEQDDETPTVQFTNVRDLFRLIDSIPGDVLTVTHVSPSNFTQIERERENYNRGIRFRRYHANSGILIITLPTKLHEALHLHLYEQYRDQLVQMGMQRSWKSMGSATYRTRGDPGGDDGGEGDSTGGPLERGGPDKWPTLVIESGDSGSLAQLHADMKWWFSASDHDVKIVLLAKFDHRQREIVLEKWEEEGTAARAGATTTRQTPTLQPVLRQKITISRDQTTDPASYNVTTGALVLRFQLLFLRDPGPQERDFTISIPDLQWYAECIWSEVRD